MLELPSGYLKALKLHHEVCDMLLIIDGAQTALERAGDMFASTHHPEDEYIVPDAQQDTWKRSTTEYGSYIEPHCTACKGERFPHTTHINDPFRRQSSISARDCH
jgi:hypothetical protein